MNHALTLLTALLTVSFPLMDAALAAHEPKFSVNTEAGTYSFETEAISLKDIRLEVGNPRAHPPLWDVLKGAQLQVGSTDKFWYHGNLWLNDPDFLIVMGDGQLKPEARSKPKYQPRESEVKGGRGYEGYSPEQAKTWATMIIMSGGLVTWADHPDDINEDGMKIVETAFEHGGGNSGVPLDLEETVTPTKWVRREGDRIYLAAINVGSSEIKVCIATDEVPELNGAKVAQDIFSGTTHTIQNGSIELTVPAFSSHCLLLK